MNNLQNYLSTCLLATAALLVGAPPAWAQTAPPLGTAADFAALGGTGVTCTSPNPPLPAVTISGGDVGSLLAIDSVTGFPPTGTLCSLSGTVRVGATQAFDDFVTAYDALAGNTCPRTEAGHNLSGDLRSGPQGNVLEPGVYCISGVGLLTGQLTLNGRGNSDAVWIFKADSSLTPIGGSVVMTNGGKACNVYWQTGTAVTLDSNTDFVGNVLAGSAISFTGVGSSLVGRALAKTLVSLTGANISGCAAIPPGTVPPGTVPNFPPACSDRVTGHGSIITNTATGDKSKFGVTGGINKKGKVRGHLTYIDDKGTNTKNDDIKVKGKVTTYLVTGTNTRTIGGTARIKIGKAAAVNGTFTVVVTDNGKSGKTDTFAITLSTPAGYSKSGTLASGNIQIKRHCDQNGEDDDDDDGGGGGGGGDDDDDD